MLHQQNVKTTPGPPRGVMVPLVLLVHPDPPGSTLAVKFPKVWIRADRSGPSGPREPQPLFVDQKRSGPPWTTLWEFPEVARCLVRHSDSRWPCNPLYYHEIGSWWPPFQIPLPLARSIIPLRLT